MRTHVLLLTILAACHPEPAARAEFVPRIPLRADEFYSTYVSIAHGSRVPLSVEQLQARCVDPRVCEAVIVPAHAPNARWPELRIIGLATGTTSAIVEYVHPRRHVPITETIEVTVAASRSLPVLADDRPLPAGERVTHEIGSYDLAIFAKRDAAHADVTIPIGRCQLGSPRARDIHGYERPDIRIFSCDRVVELEDKVWRYRACAGDRCSFPADEQYILCTQTRNGVVQADAVLAPTLRDGGLQVRSRDSQFTNDHVCRPADKS